MRATVVGRSSYLFLYTLMRTALGDPSQQSRHNTGTAGRVSASMLSFSRHLLRLFCPNSRYSQHLKSLQALVWSHTHNPAMSTSAAYQKLRQTERRMCFGFGSLTHLKSHYRQMCLPQLNQKSVWSKLSTSFSSLTHLVDVTLFLVEVTFRLYPLISSPKCLLSCLVNKSQIILKFQQNRNKHQGTQTETQCAGPNLSMHVQA